MKILFFLMAILATQFAFSAPIRLLGPSANPTLHKNIIKNKLLKHPRYKNKQFRQVIVREVKNRGQKYLVAYLKDKNVYHFESAIVSLKRNNTVSRIEPNVSINRLRTLVRVPGIVLNL